MQPILRRFLLGGLLLLGLVWIWFSRTEVPAIAHLQPAPQPGFPAPDFSLEMADGQTINLASLRGKPVIVNFWASWCPPCRAEMPAFQAIHDEYPDRVGVLAVNAALQDNPADMQAFLDETRITFPVLLDAEGSVHRLYAITSLPTTFFIDGEGVIEEIVVGGPLTHAGLLARLESLLEVAP